MSINEIEKINPVKVSTYTSSIDNLNKTPSITNEFEIREINKVLNFLIKWRIKKKAECISQGVQTDGYSSKMILLSRKPGEQNSIILELLKLINIMDCETTLKTTKILRICWMILKSHP